jgi:hypothetical protein
MAERPDALSLNPKAEVIPPKVPPYSAGKKAPGKSFVVRVTNSWPHSRAVARADAIPGVKAECGKVQGPRRSHRRPPDYAPVAAFAGAFSGCLTRPTRSIPLRDMFYTTRSLNESELHRSVFTGTCRGSTGTARGRPATLFPNCGF